MPANALIPDRARPDPDGARVSHRSSLAGAESPLAEGDDMACAGDPPQDLVTAGPPDRSDPRGDGPRDSRERARALHPTAEPPPGSPLTADRSAVPAAMPEAQLGPLADATPDTMTLHTQEAYGLFTGRPADAEGRVPAIPGGRRFAAILKSLWHLSAHDNPYADWILIRMYDGLVAIRKHLEQVIGAREREMAALERKGLTLAVMASRRPQSVALGFRSPYGYATAEAIVEFDYHVRMVKTLVQKDRLSDAEGRAAIREIGRKLRALFLEPVRWERTLLREALRPLSRSDFLPGADEPARQRVRAAIALFGEVPRRVFTGADAPRHSQRRARLTELELRLLEEASLTVAEEPAQPDTDLL